MSNSQKIIGQNKKTTQAYKINLLAPEFYV